MIHMILLAAGNSCRFGENKLLYPFLGKAMYLHIFDRLCELTGEYEDLDLRVVTQFEEIKKEAEGRRIPAIWNDHSSIGISSSLKLGVESVKVHGGEDCYMFFVADQPHITKKTISGFIRAFLESGCFLGCVCFDGKKGNPAVFHEKYREELLQLEGGRGGKELFAVHGADAFYYTADCKRELLDYDEKGGLTLPF